jgi:UDP-glucose 4-epimerase
MAAAPLAKPVLVTGGRGCLAGVLRQHFAAHGLPAITYSRRAGDGHLALDSLLTDPLPFDSTLLHLAWSTVPFTSEHHADLEHDEILLRRLLERFAAHPQSHFIFFSSGGTVYGNAQNGRPHRETDRCAPIGRHGRAKLAAEALVEEYGRRHGFAWTILRVANPYGFPVSASRPQGIVPVALKCAREGLPLTIWGDGTARKDFLYYSDYSAAVELVVRQRLIGIFNVCSGQSHTIREVIGLVGQAVGHEVIILQTAAPAWDVHDSLLDNTKLLAAIGWRAAVSLADGIRRAAAELPPL